MDEEIWKTCSDFNMYKVSNLGQVKNKNTGKILKQAIHGGYKCVGLMLNNKIISRRVHRLVAKEFIENLENKPQVNHIDKNRSNNIVSNLEWTTAKENNVHRSTGVMQTTNQNIRVWRVDNDTNEKLELYNSFEEAGQWLVENKYSNCPHTARTNISNAVRGIYKSSCGFKWIRNEQEHLENEEWRNIIINGETNENYQISSMGRFKNSKGIIMENYKPHHSGYIFCRVNIEKYPLHRLVAFTFLENPENKPVVNHIDGNKTNNSVNNLEWCTIAENNQHNHNIGLIKSYKRKIGQYTIDGELVKEFNSIVEAVNETKIGTIKHVLHKKQNTAGGFIWKYSDEIKEN
jgi:hypothetical protein